MLTLCVILAALTGCPTDDVVAQRSSAARSATITTPDGVTLHFLESGSGPAILFVPGWTMPAEIFEPQLTGLGGRWRVVSMDPRGHGRSEKATDGYDLGTRARDIRAVIDRLKLAPVVLVGWSNGATEVASYIDQFGTEGLAGVVFVDGTAGGTATPEEAAARMKLLPKMLTERRAFTESFVKSMFRTPQPEAYLRGIVHGALQTPTTVAVTTGLAASVVDFRPALSKIDRPAMIVAARSPFTKWFEEMRDRIPNARYEVMDGVGHALFADDAPRFNALLEEFARTTQAAPPGGRSSR
jgi:microsomal epoxide hydrolase